MCEIDWNLLGAIFTGLGTVIVGIGTIAIGYGAIKSIPEELRKRSGPEIDPELMKRYQMFAMRALARVEADNMAIAGRTEFPSNFSTFLPLLVKSFPQLGTVDDAQMIITDLMRAGRIQYSTRLQNNTPILRTIYWQKNGKRRIEQIALTEEGHILK